MNGIYQWLLRAAIAVIASLTVNAIMGWLDQGWLSLLLNVATSAAAMFGISYLLDRQAERYAKRINNPSSIDCDVRLNGILIGTLPDATYAAMQLEAFRDERNALAQLWNVGRVAITVFDRMIVVVPVLVFWGALAIAVFSPYTYTEMLLEFQKADAATITRALQGVVKIGLSFVVMTMIIMPMFGFRFGFKNCYAEAVDQMLRHKFNTPVDGEFRVTRPLLATMPKDNKPC
ncbi:hypothetical protein QCD61_28185 (plasmid) [Pseudomonas viciae]|uniref:Uncharacterized protein n=1 Tax=Pseudomonas viciae TaxID=2505979 RepID=A0ABY8PMH2_9PSED|nr:hypothetical protein [Pseudomonas viciae]WGO96444.1 hypothetical protein QCD61_28185 [Pseudomonas viciae]